MYVKYLMNRIKNSPSKMWKDWKSWRNYPGMEYRDVHEIIPKSHLWKFPGPGSIKYEPDGCNKDYFKWDFKTAYRYSIYFVRRLVNSLPPKYKINHALPLTDQDIKEMGDRHPNWKDHVQTHQIAFIEAKNMNLEEKHNYYTNLIQTNMEHSTPFQEIAGGVVPSNIYMTYFPVYDNYGSDKNVDPSDMDAKWLYIYFDNMQHLYNDDLKLKEENNYMRDMYVGRTKAWQVLPDFYGKDQVDKVQVAIGAPLQDQLDEWESENINKKVPMPMNNENLHKFRDDPDHFETLDHDYERILFERQKKQKYEQMRNTRYEELLQLYHKNNIINH